MSILSHPKFRQVGQDIVDAFEALQIDDRYRQVALRRAVGWITTALASVPEPTVVAASPVTPEIRETTWSLEKLRERSAQARGEAEQLGASRAIVDYYDTLEARLRRLEDMSASDPRPK